MYDLITKIMETQARTMDTVLSILEKNNNKLKELSKKIYSLEKEIELLKNKK